MILLYLAVSVYVFIKEGDTGNTPLRIWNALLWPVLAFTYALDSLISYLERKDEE
jgi:hypothetical protein